MLNLLVTTQAEAEPVISTLRLRKVPALFNCFQSNDVNLVIAGMGKCNTATAVGWLANKTLPADSVYHTSVAWLNIGIAGHPDAARGTALMAHKVTDLATGKVWFPHRMNTHIASAELVTVDQALPHYLPNQLHDMEASAFIEAARKFSDAELVQTLKVVSDNKDQPLAEVNAKLATRLITNNVEHIHQCISVLRSLCAIVKEPEDTVADAILETWRFSVSQKVQLARLLQRHSVLLEPLTDMPDSLLAAKSSKEVLKWLQNTVDNAGYR